MDELVEQVAAKFLAGGLTLAVAEASTGGYLANLLTDRPGASGYFLGGLIPYSNRSKTALLGLPPELLAAHGAASAEAAAALATGVRKLFRSDIGLAVTGLLGPKAGRSPKPVGLAYVAVADERGVRVRERQFDGDRRSNKAGSAEAALQLLIEAVEGSAAEPGRR